MNTTPSRILVQRFLCALLSIASRADARSGHGNGRPQPSTEPQNLSFTLFLHHNFFSRRALPAAQECVQADVLRKMQPCGTRPPQTPSRSPFTSITGTRWRSGWGRTKVMCYLLRLSVPELICCRPCRPALTMLNILFANRSAGSAMPRKSRYRLRCWTVRCSDFPPRCLG